MNLFLKMMKNLTMTINESMKEMIEENEHIKKKKPRRKS